MRTYKAGGTMAVRFDGDGFAYYVCEVYPHVSGVHADGFVRLPETLPEVGAAFSGVRAEAVAAIWLAEIGLASFSIALGAL